MDTQVLEREQTQSKKRTVEKVFLINPPRFNELIGKNPAIVEKNRGYNPPLGILSLAGYLENQSKYKVDLLDAQPKEYSYAELEQVLRERLEGVDVVGITAMTFTLIDVIKTVKLCKEINPDVVVVLGGPHVHIYPDETISIPEVDYLVQGEGEITFLKLLDNLDDKDELKKHQGYVFEADGKVINTGISPSTENLDELGIPARHLTDINDYSSLLGRANTITTMFTSRGCPFRCTFCDRPFSPVISGFRARTAKHVVDEMEQCIQMGITEAFIYDDTFTVKKDRVEELCDEIIARGIDFKWDVRAHVNTVTPDLLKKMHSAGCDRIHFGVEAGNDRMLKVIKKNTTTARVREAIGWAKDSGMEVLAYFIIGQQTETREDIEDTIKFAKSLDANYVHFTIFCPYPATEVYAMGLQQGTIKQDVWREFSKNPGEGFEIPMWEENFTKQELREMLVHCYKSFYLRPGYILRRLMNIRSWGEFKRKAKAGLSVITMKAGAKYDTLRDLEKKVSNIVPRAPISIHTSQEPTDLNKK